ncbi:DNA topoisomerase-1 [Rheinheimera pacifica]|uniref:type I DNA topoisomerase n=1 Tax=Rheinheimera pacifica TaxID=173990 RepID=UPI002169409E|nr:type I DNA topoisomerase [Rheinheimera pacifica]MCS4309676.1 DNA topoisomerase-1 [Rheinheimera pacifica]
MTTLMIVESPKKAKTIGKLLGSTFSVVATKGHFRDLPNHSLGIDLETLEALYVCEGENSATRKKLFQYIKQSTNIILATDLDREGEAIAWHVVDEFKLKPERYTRILYNEITAAAIKKAIANPVPLDLLKVEAQKTRRALDRVIGFPVSSELRRQTQLNITAGRVQSVAVLIIVKREREIELFKVTKHFGARFVFSADDVEFEALWDTKKCTNDESPYIKDLSLAQSVAAIRNWVVTSSSSKPYRRSPPPPFTTITMQQAASNRLGFEVDKTMRLAQGLFEKGIITYHRTDSPNLSQEAVEAIRALIVNNCGESAIPSTPRVFNSSEGAQEAHEAIRPSDITVKDFTDDIEPDAISLYRLIRQRVIASQMEVATYDVTELLLQSEDKPGITAKVSGRVLRSAGWLQIMQKDDSAEDAKPDDNSTVPALPVGTRLSALHGEVTQHTTKPPGRYSESGLLAELERQGVGRPATYSSIISVIKKREFVMMKARQFIPTDHGFLLVDALTGRFKFMDVGYTKEIERGLDYIATGKTTYNVVLAAAVADVKAGLLSLAETPIVEPHPCFECGKPLRRIVSKNGAYEPFWGCTDSKECNATAYDLNGKPKQEPGNPAYPCPVCSAPLRRTRKKNEAEDGTVSFKPNWLCTRWKEGCKTVLGDKAGSPLKGYSCPGCKKHLLKKRKGKHGTFWSCAGYPACKVICKDSGGKPSFKNIRM